MIAIPIFPLTIPHFSLYWGKKMMYNKKNYELKGVCGMSCIKCGKKLGASQVFCDECLEKAAQCPVNPSAVVRLPDRSAQPIVKKKPSRRLYFWNMENEIGALQSKIRWLRFALIVAILGFLLSVVLIFMLLYWQGRLDFIARLLTI